MAGRHLPPHQSISRLTSPHDSLLSKCRRSRHAEFQPDHGRHPAIQRKIYEQIGPELLGLGIDAVKQEKERQSSPSAAATIGSAPASFMPAATVKDIFEKYNLIGNWAWDCKKPPGNDNLYFVNRALDAVNVQRDFMKSSTERAWVALITEATPLGPTEVRVAGTLEGEPTEGVWRVEGNRMTQLYETQAGRKVIENGRYAGANGAEVPPLNKCGATGQQAMAPPNPQVASVAESQAPPADARTTEAPSSKVVASGVDTLIGKPVGWDKYCNPRPVSVTVTSPPANGTITVADTIVKATQLKVGSDKGGCLGKPIAGKKIVYRSNPGYHGPDSITYKVTLPQGEWTTTVNINVQ